jgi:hypothetical protein
MLVSVFKRVLVLCCVLGLIGCGGGSGGGKEKERLVTVSGRVLNGPIEGATVSVRDASGSEIGTAISDADGMFSVQVSNPQSPLRLQSTGGDMGGVPYSGVLAAYCSVADSATTLDCPLTPYSTLLAQLVAGGLSLADARTRLFRVFALNQDPFVQDAAVAGSVPTYLFDVAAARTAINGGAGLSGWLTDMVAWVDIVVAWKAAGDPYADLAGTPPMGTPVYRITLQQLTGNGSAGPDSVDLAMGERAEFSIVPATNYVASVSGCGGTLDGNLYTTAAIVSVGVISGVCQVKVSFALEKFALVYSAGEGGLISGAATQQVSYGGSGSEVEAVALTGYRFVNWSDAVDTAKRQEINVTADLSVTANFAIRELTLTYIAGDNGQLRVSDELMQQSVQTVLYGGNGSPVEAVANPGYRFVRWSDNILINPRTDNNVGSDRTLTAIFEPTVEATPWLQRLHDGELQVQIEGPTRAVLGWPMAPDISYDLYISPTETMVLSDYATFGGMLLTNVTSPLILNDLAPGEPVYVAVALSGATDAQMWSSFVPRSIGLDGEVRAQAVDAESNRYVGGDFSSAQLNLRGAVALAPVTASQSVSHPLVFPDVDGIVHAMVDDGKGGWYIGGEFSRVGGLPRQDLAHIDAGGEVSEWDAFVSGSNARVNALQIFDNYLLVGGLFDYAEGVDGLGLARSNFAVFAADGKLVANIATPVNGEVHVLLSAQGLVYIGGDFSAVAGQARNSLAVLNDSGVVLHWPAGTDGVVHAIVISGDRLIVGGDFSQVLFNGVPSPRSLLAALDADGEPLPFTPEFAGPADMSVDALLVQGTDVLVAGNFSDVNGEPRGGFAAFDSNGVLLASDIVANGRVRSLASDGNVLYLGGDFSAVSDTNGTQSRAGVAAFADSTLLDWDPALTGTVSDVQLANGVLLAAGSVSGAARQSRQRLAAFDVDGNLLPWAPAADAMIHALQVETDTVYVGGAFTELGNPLADTARMSLAALDRQSGDLLDWNPGTDGVVNTLAIDAGVIYAGGSFSEAAALPRQNLAAFDAFAVLQPWNAATDAAVRSLLISGTTVYAGGDFTLAGAGTADTGRLRLAAFDNTGALLGWNPGADNSVHTLTMLNGAIYAGGDFLFAGGGSADTGRNHLAAFDNSGTLLGWNPGTDATVVSLSAMMDTLYAVGEFTEAGAAQARLGAAAFDETGLLLDWYPGKIPSPRSVLATGGVIAIGGGFSSVGSMLDDIDAPRGGLALFDDAGVLLER